MRSLEDRLRRQHCAVDLQDLLLLDEVLPPNLQDVVLQSAAHGAKVIQTTDTWTTPSISKKTLNDLHVYKKKNPLKSRSTSIDSKSLVIKEAPLQRILHLGSVNNVIFGL